MENQIIEPPSGPENTGPLGQNLGQPPAPENSDPGKKHNFGFYILGTISLILIGLGIYFLGGSGLFKGQLRLQQEEVEAIKECISGIPENIEGNLTAGGFYENWIYNLQIKENCAVEIASSDETKARIFYNKIISATPSADDPLTVTFTTENNLEGAALIWDFGDGTIEETTGETVKSHTYFLPESYPVRVLAKKSFGEKEVSLSAGKTVTVTAENNDTGGGEGKTGNDNQDGGGEGGDGTTGGGDGGGGDGTTDGGGDGGDGTTDGGDGETGGDGTVDGGTGGTSEVNLDFNLLCGDLQGYFIRSMDNHGDFLRDNSGKIIFPMIRIGVDPSYIGCYIEPISHDPKLNFPPEVWDVESYFFDFGDGSVQTNEITAASGPTLSVNRSEGHLYEKDGIYTINVEIRHKSGKIFKKSAVVELRPRIKIEWGGCGRFLDIPSPKLFFSATPLAQCRAKVESAHTYGKSTIKWDFGDGTVFEESRPDPDENKPPYVGKITSGTSHVFPAFGQYEVNITVSDEKGNTATTKHNSNIVQYPPINSIKAEYQIAGIEETNEGKKVTITDISSAIPQWAIEKWSWNWGDGSEPLNYDYKSKPPEIFHLYKFPAEGEGEKIYRPELTVSYGPVQKDSYSSPNDGVVFESTVSGDAEPVGSENPESGAVQNPDTNPEGNPDTNPAAADNGNFFADTFHSTLDGVDNLANPVTLGPGDAVAVMSYDLDSAAENIIKIRFNNKQWELDINQNEFITDNRADTATVKNNPQTEAAASSGGGGGGGGGGVSRGDTGFTRNKNPEKEPVKEQPVSESSDTAPVESETISRSTEEGTPEAANGSITIGDIIGLEQFVCLKAAEEPASFSDISPDNETINLLAAISYGGEAIFQGFSKDGIIIFNSEAFINRAEILKVLMVASCTPYNLPFTGNAFKDVAPKDWHYSFVGSAKEQNIVEGYEDNTYRPGQEVSRMEAIKMLAEISGIDEADDSCEEAPFTDVTSEHWGYRIARNAFCADISAGKMIGDERYLFPDESLTRGEMATLLYNYYVAVIRGN